MRPRPWPILALVLLSGCAMARQQIGAARHQIGPVSGPRRDARNAAQDNLDRAKTDALKLIDQDLGAVNTDCARFSDDSDTDLIEHKGCNPADYGVDLIGRAHATPGVAVCRKAALHLPPDQDRQGAATAALTLFHLYAPLPAVAAQNATPDHEADCRQLEASLHFVRVRDPFSAQAAFTLLDRVLGEYRPGRAAPYPVACDARAGASCDLTRLTLDQLQSIEVAPCEAQPAAAAVDATPGAPVQLSAVCRYDLHFRNGPLDQLQIVPGPAGAIAQVRIMLKRQPAA